MFARLLIICALAWAASAASSVDPAAFSDRFRLACSGTMATADTAGDTILADGVVDLAGGNVYGFGLGGQEIQLIRDNEIVFGSGGGRSERRMIEGLIDRDTLATEILVYAVGDEETPVIAMRLDCRMKPPFA
jgi:hypothetical protein